MTVTISDPSDLDPHSAPLPLYSLRVYHLPLRPTPTLIMGVEIKTLAAGDGTSYPKKGDTVKIHYVGTLLNGTKFDSSRDRGDPFETKIGVGRVIRGWDEGVPQLSLGQKAILTITADYAYGERGYPPKIPPNSSLQFEVELLEIRH